MRKLRWASLFLAISCSRFASEKKITLRFTPKENVTANIPAGEGLFISRQIEILPLTDARSLADKSVVGENREHSTPVPIRSTTPVQEFATTVLKQCLGEWGARLGPGDLQLRGEITNLLVTEDQTYSTSVSMRFRLEDRAGKVVWDGIIMGDAHQWGSSFKEENYVEEISDALKRTYANLVSNSGFQKAWVGSATPKEAILSPDELRMKVQQMMAGGLSEDTIASFVRDVKLARPLTADEVLDWKKAGVAEPIIRAAIAARR